MFIAALVDGTQERSRRGCLQELRGRLGLRPQPPRPLTFMEVLDQALERWPLESPERGDLVDVLFYVVGGEDVLAPGFEAPEISRVVPWFVRELHRHGRMLWWDIDVQHRDQIPPRRDRVVTEDVLGVDGVPLHDLVALDYAGAGEQRHFPVGMLELARGEPGLLREVTLNGNVHGQWVFRFMIIQGDEDDPMVNFHHWILDQVEILGLELSWISDWVQATGANLEPLDWRTAVREQALWRQHLHGQEPKASRRHRPRGEQVADFGNGWTVWALTSRKGLDAEGRILRHCVGDYWDAVRDGSSLIYSLRRDGAPRVAFEIAAEDVRELQAFGDRNRKLSEKERRLVSTFEMRLKMDHDKDVIQRLEIEQVLPSGYRVYRTPPVSDDARKAFPHVPWPMVRVGRGMSHLRGSDIGFYTGKEGRTVGARVRVLVAPEPDDLVVAWLHIEAPGETPYVSELKRKRPVDLWRGGDEGRGGDEDSTIDAVRLPISNLGDWGPWAHPKLIEALPEIVVAYPALREAMAEGLEHLQHHGELLHRHRDGSTWWVIRGGDLGPVWTLTPSAHGRGHSSPGWLPPRPNRWEAVMVSPGGVLLGRYSVSGESFEQGAWISLVNDDQRHLFVDPNYRRLPKKKLSAHMVERENR